jgi:hypothetical protein
MLFFYFQDFAYYCFMSLLGGAEIILRNFKLPQTSAQQGTIKTNLLNLFFSALCEALY